MSPNSLPGTAEPRPLIAVADVPGWHEHVDVVVVGSG